MSLEGTFRGKHFGHNCPEPHCNRVILGNSGSRKNFIVFNEVFRKAFCFIVFNVYAPRVQIKNLKGTKIKSCSLDRCVT